MILKYALVFYADHAILRVMFLKRKILYPLAAEVRKCQINMIDDCAHSIKKVPNI